MVELLHDHDYKSWTAGGPCQFPSRMRSQSVNNKQFRKSSDNLIFFCRCFQRTLWTLLWLSLPGRFLRLIDEEIRVHTTESSLDGAKKLTVSKLVSLLQSEPDSVTMECSGFGGLFLFFWQNKGGSFHKHSMQKSKSVCWFYNGCIQIGNHQTKSIVYTHWSVGYLTCMFMWRFYEHIYPEYN